jgi:hypothetical protein
MGFALLGPSYVAGIASQEDRISNTMINLGIVIAVSEYTHDAKPLPACARDGAAMSEVLRLSGRFDHILQIDEDTKSTSVKQRLTEFVNAHAGSDIDHIVFYFTGHGSFTDNEFYYLLTIALAASMSSSVSFGGRPPVRPRRRAAARPAWVRSRIRLRSNSANAPNM